MGNLITETPFSEVTASLETLSSLGLTRFDLTRLRSNRKLAEEVVLLIKKRAPRSSSPDLEGNLGVFSHECAEVLHRGHITRKVELLAVSLEGLGTIRGANRRLIEEVERFLETRGFTLPADHSAWMNCTLQALSSLTMDELMLPLYDIPLVTDAEAKILSAWEINTVADFKGKLELKTDMIDELVLEFSRVGAYLRAYFR